jgi:hypothetical protein
VRRRHLAIGTGLAALLLAALLVGGRLVSPEPGGSTSGTAPTVVSRSGPAAVGGRPPPRFATAPAAVNGGRPAQAPVVDLAELSAGSAPSTGEPGEARIVPGEGMTAEELANPQRYFEAATRRPELLRPEELGDARAFFVRYRDQLTADLRRLPATRDPAAAARARADLQAVIRRYDAAIERADRLLGPTRP